MVWTKSTTFLPIIHQRPTPAYNGRGQRSSSKRARSEQANTSSNDEALMAFLRFDRGLPALEKLLSDMEMDAGTHKIDCAVFTKVEITRSPPKQTEFPLAGKTMDIRVAGTVAGSELNSNHPALACQETLMPKRC
ncbi:unnamed protein product [Phytophthora lilii]|uniref:Unnamed protein product n=1 Tax=Phytophthora lilii TaxID=2077276 RepID=A0A9W6TFY8_9STRA|nr:unnamed protein product [Phytophthora lilii]